MMKKYTFPKIRRSGMLLLALLAFRQIAWAQGLSGTGTSNDPYLINDSIDWNWFAQSITNDSTYAGKFVQLTDDIIVGTMAGIENKCFSGTFDGQGHTITLDMTATMQFTALFCYADGATFRNLKVDGVLNTSKKFCASLVGAVVYHGCTFTNCVSDVTINSSVNGDGSHGGFVSFLWRANTFEGCAFTGKLLGPSTTNVGGFVGFTETNQNGSVTFTNCLFIPEEVTMSGDGSQTFARWRSGDNAVTIGTNCYYSQTLGAAQGKMMHSITGIKSANVAFHGNHNTYNVSGISAYSTGIGLTPLTPSPQGEGKALYAGYGEMVNLGLSHDDHPGYTYGDGYTASAGNLTPTEVGLPVTYGGERYTLAMPDEDVTIEPEITAATVSVACTPNIYGAVLVSLDNTNWSSSVSTPVGNPVYFRFNTPNGYAFDPLGLYIHTEEGSPVNYTGNHFTMPASNVTIHADFIIDDYSAYPSYTVTLSPGAGTGNPIVYTFDPATAAPNAASADPYQFYYVNYNTIGFRLSGCPDSFTAPAGYTFNEWDNYGYVTLTSTATTFTAQWDNSNTPLSPVTYIDGNGEYHTCGNYTVLTGGEGNTTLSEGWYVVNSNINCNNLNLNDNVTLILCNDKTMTVSGGFGYNSFDLTIYGQSLNPSEAGILTSDCPIISSTFCDYTQHSGNVILNCPNHNDAFLTNHFTINGGSLHSSGKNNGISTNYLTINGGKVETNKIFAKKGDITLGYTNADDYIFASSYETHKGTISVKYGQAFYYENDNGEQVIVFGELNADQIEAIAGKTLHPYTTPTTVTKDIAGYGNGNGGWHLIASPLLGNIDPATVGNMIPDSASHYDLYRFDQYMEPLEWRNYKADSTFRLEACKGYLYANTDSVTLIFNGVPYIGNGKVLLDKSTVAQLKGWNLIGNPFSTAKTIGSKPFYRMNSLGTEIIAAENNIVEAMEGIFVVADTDGEVVTFADVPRGNSQGDERIVLNLSGPSTSSETAVIDRAIIRFGEGQTLPKSQIGNNSTKIYIPQDGKDYAVVNIDRDAMHCVSTEIPIHFKAAENGEYTLSVSESLNSKFLILNYLHLIDSLTGSDIDLLATPTYTFIAKTTDYASRFKLVFSAK